MFVRFVSLAGVLGYCRAQYDYAATAANQISLREGDVIAIVSKAGEKNGWWKGSKDGQVSEVAWRMKRCTTLTR